MLFREIVKTIGLVSWPHESRRYNEEFQCIIEFVL